MNQKQKVFEDNCGDDENFITTLAITISCMIVTLFNAIFIEIIGVAISSMWLIIWWLIIGACISAFYYIEKNKEIEG
ncbi:hypothetical protein KAU33_16035 [Candidatus Dependentiae bacterium]|nr:hypothetical protein [Candidatus Dependentiae bacterium]